MIAAENIPCAHTTEKWGDEPSSCQGGLRGVGPLIDLASPACIPSRFHSAHRVSTLLAVESGHDGLRKPAASPVRRDASNGRGVLTRTEEDVLVLDPTIEQ